MPLKIRQASKKDLPTCAQILLEEFNKQNEGWAIKAANNRLAELLQNTPELCFCLELDNQTIGFVFGESFEFIKGKYLLISEFVIKEEFQRKGFGQEALKFIESHAKQKGFKVLSLFANTKERAFRIYEKFGFEPTNYTFMEKEL